VLRDVPVVLLDEPTAHLDAAREEELRHVLAPWLEGRSVVMAAHRGGLLGRVDRTVTLLAGHVVAGPPATARPATAPPDVARAAAAARPFGTGGTG
jgi:ABC-type transport system involved in cytochrome bd biosynthesis fused ATPase/permease subunit